VMDNVFFGMECGLALTEQARGRLEVRLCCDVMVFFIILLGVERNLLSTDQFIS